MKYELFAVRHKPTGNFIPRSGNAPRGGYSYVEPREFKGPSDGPRLFDSPTAAENFIRQWVRGHHHRNGDEQAVSVTPVANRHKEHMEIVIVRLVVGGSEESIDD